MMRQGVLGLKNQQPEVRYSISEAIKSQEKNYFVNFLFYILHFFVLHLHRKIGARVIEINFWEAFHRKAESPATGTVLLSQIHNEVG